MALIDEMAAMQIFYVNIGGGEPMIRRDFFELVEHAVDQRRGREVLDQRHAHRRRRRPGAWPRWTTSTSRSPSTAPTRRPTTPYAARAATTGRARAMDHLAAADFGPFKISVVMTRDNVDQLDEFEALAERYGAQLRLTRLRPSGRGVDVWDQLHPTREQNRRLYRGCSSVPTCSPATPSSTSRRSAIRSRASTSAARGGWSA